jgi:hypothetical protein
MGLISRLPNEGLRVAKTENRPVLIWVSGDDPLERC